MVTAEAVRQAAALLNNIAVRTPLLWAEPLRAYLKLEHLQPVGAFKARGAYTAVSRLPASARQRGIISIRPVTMDRP